MRKWSWVLAVLVGCGEVHDDSGHVDAATDAADIIDAPPPLSGHHHFVIDRVVLPATNTQATAYGLDLDGDAIVDNQLGMVLAVLAGMGLDSQPTMDSHIDSGVSIMLADVTADDLVTATTAGFTIYRGSMPVPAPCADAQDTVCRKHLDGSGSFTIDTATPADPPLVGTIADSVEDAGPGHLSIQFALATSTRISVRLLGARVSMTSTDATSTGNLAGAISTAEIDNKVIPAMRDGFTPVVQNDCTDLQSPPDCGCAVDSQGKTLLGIFDTDPKDCSISTDEVRNNPLIVSLFAPDVTVENTEALSLGFRVHAVPATFSDL